MTYNEFISYISTEKKTKADLFLAANEVIEQNKWLRDFEGHINPNYIIAVPIFDNGNAAYFLKDDLNLRLPCAIFEINKTKISMVYNCRDTEGDIEIFEPVLEKDNSSFFATYYLVEKAINITIANIIGEVNPVYNSQNWMESFFTEEFLNADSIRLKSKEQV